MATPSRLPLPDLADLGEALAAGRQNLAIGGIVPGARSLVVAAIGEALRAVGRCVVVVPHAADAEELVAGLGLLAPDTRAGVVPDDLTSVYQGVEPPLASRLELVRLLARAARDQIDLLVVPVRALSGPIPEPSSIDAAALRLRRGGEVDTLDLAHDLAAAGYRRVDLVEDVGEFAVRGWVVDIHPGGGNPVRLELDDVVIESIRSFDASSQRSIGTEIDELEILPLDPFPSSETRRNRLVSLLEPSFPVLASQVRAGVERRLWWGAFGLEDPESTNWLDLGRSIVVCDRDDVIGELQRWFDVQDREWRTQQGRGVHLPGPESLLVSPTELSARLENPDLRIERLEVADDQTRWWRLKTHPVESFVRRIPDLTPVLRRRRAEDYVQVLAVATEGEERRFRHLLEGGEVVPVSRIPGPNEVAVLRSGVRVGFVWEGRLAVYGRRALTAVPRPRPEWPKPTIPPSPKATFSRCSWRAHRVLQDHSVLAGDVSLVHLIKVVHQIPVPARAHQFPQLDLPLPGGGKHSPIGP